MSDSDVLIRRWADRDERYSMRRSNGKLILLSEQEREAVITFRREEALALPAGSERVRALTELSQWAR
jgi:hypothetical protein